MLTEDQVATIKQAYGQSDTYSIDGKYGEIINDLCDTVEELRAELAAQQKRNTKLWSDLRIVIKAYQRLSKAVDEAAASIKK